MISITLIGSGNVATHLYNAIKNCETIVINEWFSRNLTQISKYSNEVSITSDLQNLKESDVYIIAVSDDAIEDVSKQLPFKDRLVVHTSGSVRLYDIDMKHKRGVFYPLQSFSKDVDLEFSEVPICVEALRKEDFNTLKTIGEALGCIIHKVNTNQRKALHLAAVFANNFTNQIYRIAHEICESQSAEFDILKPLIKETARKIDDVSPYKAQTGPAKRGDKKTIKKQLKMLDNEMQKDVYELLTKSIKQTHGQR
ncbi:Rossmann-like and DUF2520 domain-containing protein [Aurantibacter sp.]|uniref:Rossmann-like and DUF2520 domain-containing protein n=1 Tax=Aurantibacter sp. TaxID=2807103 RepID=UPI0035C80C84